MLYLFTLTWNACDKLTKLKKSLLPALSGIDYTWLIKDNASKDNTVAEAATWGDKVKIIPYKNNLQNFAAGMNYLFTEAAPQDNDLIMLLNNDIIFNDKKSIKSMIELLNKDKDIGAVGCRLLYTDTDRIQHAGTIFDKRTHSPVHFRAKEKTDFNAERNRLFQAVTGAVCLTKAEYYKNVWTQNKSGNLGMDENYHWAFEDVDLCLAIHYNMGKKIVYCGSTNVFHEESASLKKNPANRLFMSHNVNNLQSKWNNRYLLDRELYLDNPQYNLYQG